MRANHRENWGRFLKFSERNLVIINLDNEIDTRKIALIVNVAGEEAADFHERGKIQLGSYLSTVVLQHPIVVYQQ